MREDMIIFTTATWPRVSSFQPQDEDGAFGGAARATYLFRLAPPGDGVAPDLCTPEILRA